MIGILWTLVCPLLFRNSPSIFHTFAHALTWTFSSFGGIPHLIHHLDDVFFTGLQPWRISLI
jgi:hypothetical protein